MADEPSDKPARVTGRKFLQALMDAGVFQPGDYVKRVVIDADIQSALKLYVQRWADTRTLPLVPLIPDLLAEEPAEQVDEASDAPTYAAPALPDTERRDLDETRRLLYMALMVNRTKKYNLAGTIVNAMKHHQKHEADVWELMDNVVALVEAGPLVELKQKWAIEQIEAITAKLDG